jgi:hypothetical protein
VYRISFSIKCFILGSEHIHGTHQRNNKFFYQSFIGAEYILAGNKHIVEENT